MRGGKWQRFWTLMKDLDWHDKTECRDLYDSYHFVQRIGELKDRGYVVEDRWQKPRIGADGLPLSKQKEYRIASQPCPVCLCEEPTIRWCAMCGGLGKVAVRCEPKVRVKEAVHAR